jgi:hypothetical protein
MGLVFCRVGEAYDDFELPGLLVEVLLEPLVEIPVVSAVFLWKGGNSSLISMSVLIESWVFVKDKHTRELAATCLGAVDR